MKEGVGGVFLSLAKGEALILKRSLFEGSPNSSFYGGPRQGEEVPSPDWCGVPSRILSPK